MAKLKVKNVGPIKAGLSGKDEYIHFDGLTVFIGDQGSGKSTIAKLFSTLSWLEKSLVRGDYTAEDLSKYRRFEKSFEYQNLQNYISKDTSFEYHGSAYIIKFKAGEPSITKASSIENYQFPKIMYVPAERNFISAVDKPELVKRLPKPLYTFMEEFDSAKQSFSSELKLPIGNFKYHFRKQNNKSEIIGEGFKIDLLEASSGIQSATPLYVVSKFIAEEVYKTASGARKEMSKQEEQKLMSDIAKRLQTEGKIAPDVLEAFLKQLNDKYTYSRFINIIEEPEQNLYPTSQRNLLFELLQLLNLKEVNRFVLTTHSPYIINYLTLAIKAKQLYNNEGVDHERLAAIVPKESAIEAERVHIYEMKTDGSISLLPFTYGLPSDENTLNDQLGEFNDQFSDLLDLQTHAWFFLLKRVRRKLPHAPLVSVIPFKPLHI